MMLLPVALLRQTDVEIGSPCVVPGVAMKLPCMAVVPPHVTSVLPDLAMMLPDVATVLPHVTMVLPVIWPIWFDLAFLFSGSSS